MAWVLLIFGLLLALPPDGKRDPSFTIGEATVTVRLEPWQDFAPLQTQKNKDGLGKAWLGFRYRAWVLGWIPFKTSSGAMLLLDDAGGTVKPALPFEPEAVAAMDHATKPWSYRDPSGPYLVLLAFVLVIVLRWEPSPKPSSQLQPS